MIDCHTHTTHSPDGAANMVTMLAYAQRLGLTGISFAEHAEWYPGDDAYGYLDMDAYFAELEAARACCAGGTRLLAGIELGNPHDFPEEARALLMRYPFDLVIGSVHWLDDLPGWQPPIFEHGLAATYQRYFEEVARMVDVANFDVLGHLDLVRRDSWDLFHETLPLDGFGDLIDRILKRLIASGRGLEINTSGLRKGLTEPVPGYQVLRRYRELGGEVLVLGSDAHRPEHIAYGFDIARDLARQAGFERTALFSRREVVDWIDL
jgi:histidinol-phosphatase (PHP family)